MNDQKSAPAASPAPEHRLECMELWGGSSETETTIRMTGLEAEVFSRAYGEGRRGGDVYYFSSCASGRISRVLLADVTGHGQEVADTATSLRDMMRRNVNVISPNRLMQGINREFADRASSGGFATALLMTYFSPTRNLTICNAGHPPPLLFRRASACWSIVGDSDAGEPPTAADLPLGVMESASFSSMTLEFQPGDLILAYTDALSESRRPSGEMFHARGIRDVLNDSSQRPKEHIIPWIFDHLKSLDPTNLVGDDATLVLIEPTGRRIPFSENLLAPLRMLRGVSETSPAL